MRVSIKNTIKLLTVLVVTSMFMLNGLVRSSAVVDEPQKTFLLYQLQTGSPTSASSELTSIVNVSTKPLRLDGLCISYSAATSENWLERACFSDPDLYTQLWIVSGGTAYIASDAFIAENPEFMHDVGLSGAMAASGGAIKLEQNGVELDLLGWGSSNFHEGSAAQAPSNSELLQRKIVANSVIDTDDNNQDFELLSQGIVAQSGVFEVELPRDMCSNIEGLQDTVPISYEEVDGECYQDVCLNIEGLQKTLEGFVLDSEGVCNEVELEDRTLTITELLPNVAGADDGKEFIEIFNPNNESVNLGGYALIVGSKSYVFPDNVLASGKYRSLSDTETGIVLPNTSGEEVVLVAPSDREVSRSAVYNNAPDDQSWILISGQWQFSNQPTPGSANKISQSSSVGGDREEEGLAPCPEGKFRNPLTNRCKTIEGSSSLVPCDVGEYRNPLTNRCNKLSSSSNSLKPCAEGQERNPATNRCRKITSSNDLGPCPEGKERNPETNRCRNVAVLGTTDNGSGPVLTASIVDVPAPNTGVNWAIISVAVLGSFAYIIYEWRVELQRVVASVRSYRYN